MAEYILFTIFLGLIGIISGIIVWLLGLIIKEGQKEKKKSGTRKSG